MLNVIASPYSFQLKTNLKFGVNEVTRLPAYLRQFGFQKVGLLVDPGVSNGQYWQQVEKHLADNHEIVYRTVGPTSEPTYDYLDEVRSGFMGKIFDCIVGVGGGSALDTAKAVSVLITNPKPAITYRGFDLIENSGPSLIAIPTTAGTGSEVSPNAVFTDKQAMRKLGINSELYVPKLAILDPMMTVSCPRSVTISSGVDALVHAIEGYVTRDATPISRMFSIQAFSLIFNSLPRLIDEPDNLSLRGQMQLGAYYAIIGLFNAGGGPTGGMSYPLGVYFDVPHGLAGAVFLPRVVQHNVEQGYLGYAELYAQIEGTQPAKDEAEASRRFVEQLWAWCDRLEIPHTLTPFGVNQTNIQTLIDQAPLLQGSFAMNPVPFTIDDMRAILKSMTSG